jgi:phospholipid/cholesterol/gamma-HCH transport system substrate-binding protein
MKNNINVKARLTFVALLLGSIVAAAIWYLFSVNQYTTYQIYTEDSVSGLIADAPIEFHGVDVGKVKSIKLVNAHSVSIVLRIDKTAPVTSTSVATITSRGLATRGFTGYVYISLEDKGTDSRPLTTPPGAPYPIIPTGPSQAMTLDTTIYQASENVQVISELLQSILDKKTIESLKQSADNMQRVTKVLAENTNKLNSIVANTERASHRLGPLLESSRETVRVLQTQILPEAHKALSNLEPLLEASHETVTALQTQILPETHRALIDLDPLVESSHDTVRALQTQILPEAHKALTDLDNLSTTLTGVANKINRDPSILIRGTTPPPPGPGEAK